MKPLRHHQHVWQIWLRSFKQNKKNWLANLLMLFVEPLLIFWAIGYGLGTFITTVDGVSYPDFFFPALLSTSAMMVTLYESTYEFYSKLFHQRIYSAMLLTPIRPSDIVLGEALWAASKGTICAAMIAIGAGLIGHVGNIFIFPSLIVIFLSCFLFAVIGFVFSTWIRNSTKLIYVISGFGLPMSLLCGTYFPTRDLPIGINYAIYLLPLTHTVSLVRGLMLGGSIWWKALIHIIFLTVLAVVIYRYACRRTENKLRNHF